MGCTHQINNGGGRIIVRQIGWYPYNGRNMGTLRHNRSFQLQTALVNLFTVFSLQHVVVIVPEILDFISASYNGEREIIIIKYGGLLFLSHARGSCRRRFQQLFRRLVRALILRTGFSISSMKRKRKPHLILRSPIFGLNLVHLTGRRFFASGIVPFHNCCATAGYTSRRSSSLIEMSARRFRTGGMARRRP